MSSLMQLQWDGIGRDLSAEWGSGDVSIGLSEHFRNSESPCVFQVHKFEFVHLKKTARMAGRFIAGILAWNEFQLLSCSCALSRSIQH